MRMHFKINADGGMEMTLLNANTHSDDDTHTSLQHTTQNIV